MGSRNASAVTAVPAHLAGLRTQLEEQRQFRLDQLADLRRADPHRTREVSDVLALGARAALRDVLAALDRMAVGTYGQCVRCGTTLPLERLEVLPQVAHCLACARNAEAQSRR